MKWNRWGPSLRTIDDAVRMASEVGVCLDDRYLPARPLGRGGIWRLRCAWLVFTGRADALIYPEQEIQ